MLGDVLREAGNDIDYEVLPNLIMMAYDGFVMNRRLNDLRDIERLADTMCDLLLGEHNKPRRPARRRLYTSRLPMEPTSKGDEHRSLIRSQSNAKNTCGLSYGRPRKNEVVPK
jgi:hypothetical protein